MRSQADANKPQEFDSDFWQDLWTKTLREHGEKIQARKPNSILTEEVMTQLSTSFPGSALDAGCGHGAETLWLALQGWNVTAVDFALAALAKGRSMAQTAGVVDKIEWIQADLGTWQPRPEEYDLVLSLYVHISGSVKEMVEQMASAVKPGGTLLLVGNRPADAKSVLVYGQTQVSVDDVESALDIMDWQLLIAEERSVAKGTDSIICVRRRV